MYADAVGNPGLSETLFQTALDLSDARRGALFVMLRDPDADIGQLIAPGDRLDTLAESVDFRSSPSRRDLMYLLANRTALDRARNAEYYHTPDPPAAAVAPRGHPRTLLARHRAGGAGALAH